MKKTLALMLLALLLIALVGGGTWAYFSDTETSTNNQLTAGTLDLKTNDADGVSQTLYSNNMAPGDTVGPSTIHLKNAGSLNGASLDMAFAYVESDGSPNLINKSADDTAAMMEVTTLNYNGSSLLNSVSDVNGNGYKDVYDLARANLTGLSGINASATKDFQIAVKLRPETGDDFQADGVTITMTFTLKQ